MLNKSNKPKKSKIIGKTYLPDQLKGGNIIRNAKGSDADRRLNIGAE